MVLACTEYGLEDMYRNDSLIHILEYVCACVCVHVCACVCVCVCVYVFVCVCG